MEMPTLAEAIEEIEYLRSNLQNPDQDAELKRNILAHLIHEIKIPPRGHGELQYYDPQQYLPMVLAKKDDGREASRNASRPVALTLVTPRGVHKKVPRVEARPESICKLDLAKIDLRKRVEATKRKV